MADPIITKIETHTYEYETENLGKDYNGFNTVYEPGSRMKSQGNVLRIETDQASSASTPAAVAPNSRPSPPLPTF